MATHAPAAPPARLLPTLDAIVRHGLWLAVAATLLVRIAALAVFGRPLESDGLAYFTLARTLVDSGLMTDHHGHHAFYSAGYPLLLAPAFALFGASVAIALAVNLALAGIAAALIWRLVHVLSGSRGASLLGGLAYAAWLPGVWLATDLARENLSVPLLLGFTLACLALARGDPRWRTAAFAGALYALGLLAGSSVVLTGGGAVVALGLAWQRRPVAGLARLAVFAGAGLLVLAPWFHATNAMIGRPVLTTNTAFNLYLGNNPAATGEFVSIMQTPVAPRWRERYATLGETGISDWLTRETADWAADHPGRVAALAAQKLALFWAPNVPDAGDFAASPLIAGLRGIEVVQYLAILALAAAALFDRTLAPPRRWTLLAIIAGFWAIHGAAYIIARYRDPVMPILIALAALTAARLAAARKPSA